MVLPANLFIDTPDLEDVSLHQLGSDVDAWPEEIIQKVKERLPRAGTMNLVVKFMKKDDENGVATGSVAVHSADKVAVIPVIIKDFMMFPMDVMIAKNKLLPLTPDYFDSIFQATELFDRVEEYPTFGGLGRFEDANLWNAVYPPSLGRYAYASAGYPIMDTISGTIDGTELSQFLKDPGNAKYAARLLSGPHAELIKKVAHLRPVNMNEFRQGVDNLVPKSIAMLRLEGPNKYTVLSNSDSVFHPGMSRMTRSECTEFLSEISDHAEDDINDVDQNGEKLLTLPEPKDPVYLAKTDAETAESATEYGHYVVKAKTGVSIEGVVIPRVINFDQKKVDLKLFIGKTMSTVQPEICGVRLKNSRFQPHYGAPKIGQTGVFIYQPDRTHALATVPVTVTAVVKEGGTVTIKATDLAGFPLKLRLGSYDLHRIAKIGERIYALPKELKWCAVEGFNEVSNSPEDYSIKQAAAKLTNTPVFVMPTGYGQYAMRGVDKYASAMNWDATNLQGYQAKFLLASLGAGESGIGRILKEAGVRGRAEVHGLKFPPLATEKVAAAKPLAAKLIKLAASLKVNAWKELSSLQGLSKKASYLENSQTVDALLSLNFVNPTNISKYIGKLPALKSAISHVAGCLLASRLGLKEIPEQAASSAMMRLVELVDGLERLRATQDIGRATGSKA